MTRVRDDLEIWETLLEHKILGEFDFGTLEQSKDSFLEDFFLIQIKKGISEDQMVPTVCHELEHYDVAKTLLNLKLFTKHDLLSWNRVEANQKIPVLTKLFKEWLHSNPSYVP